MPTPQEALRARLAELEAQVAGDLAFVFDAWGLVWRTSRFGLSKSTEHMLLSHVGQMLESVDPSLARGGRLRGSFSFPGASISTATFATVYVVAAQHANDQSTLRVRTALRDALPEIERLTLALPPPGGPGASSGRAALA